MNELNKAFEEADPFHRVMILFALANNGRQEEALRLYGKKNCSCETLGLDVNVILANVLVNAGKLMNASIYLKDAASKAATKS